MRWISIETAPKFATRQKEVKGQKVDIAVPVPIWTLRDTDGHVTKSEWDANRSAWSGYTADGGPTHWQPYRTSIELLREIAALEAAADEPLFGIEVKG